MSTQALFVIPLLLWGNPRFHLPLAPFFALSAAAFVSSVEGLVRSRLGPAAAAPGAEPGPDPGPDSSRRPEPEAVPGSDPGSEPSRQEASPRPAT